MRRKRFAICACVTVFVYYFFGVGDYLFSKSFEEEFNYPLNIDLQPVVEEALAGNDPGVKRINHYPYRYLSTTAKCSKIKRIDLMIMVKSAIEHFEQRKAVRLTYGRENFLSNRTVKVVFFLGVHGNPDPSVRKRVVAEREEFADIVQMDFEDNYYNMTIKTMMSFRWAYEQCPIADYYLFTDDDMYISVPNLLKYVDLPASSAGRRQREVMTRSRAYRSDLFAGYVFESSPQRFWPSKWRVTLEEYPWNRWPAYVTAGAYVVSNRSMKAIHVASAYVKHFRFDDIYLGIVARKLGIELTHCEDFHFYKKRYTKQGYKGVIASHGYGDPHELISVWNDQHSLHYSG